MEENATQTYGILQTAFGQSWMNRASVFEWHKRFKEARESVRDDERCGRSKEVHTRELIGQRVRVRVTMLKFLGSSGKIPSEEASTLQIGSVAFPPGQCTSSQLRPCHRLFDQDGNQDSSSPSLLSRPCSYDFCLFPKLRGSRYETIEEIKEAVTKVLDMLTQENFHGTFQKLLERHNKSIAAGEDYFEGDQSFMCVLSIKVPIQKCLETYLMILV